MHPLLMGLGATAGGRCTSTITLGAVVNTSGRDAGLVLTLRVIAASSALHNREGSCYRLLDTLYLYSFVEPSHLNYFFPGKILGAEGCAMFLP